MVAPTNSANIYDVVCVVFLITLFKSLKESLPLIRAKIDAPSAPTPDASVGVAIPIKMLPSTAIINKAGGIIDLNTLKISIDNKSNPNGSSNNIAGLLNAKKNVLGMMPHPERLIDPVLSGEDGSLMFESLLKLQ